MFGSLKRWLHNRPQAVASVRVLEVKDATPLAGALFLKSFGSAIPDFERHFVLIYEPQRGVQVTLGYIHQTAFEAGHLCGGLVVDAWHYRKLPPEVQAMVQANGGMAEWLLRASREAVQPTDAVFAYVGSPKSLIVVTRLGYRHVPGHPHLMVLASENVAAQRVDELTEKVKALGPF